MAYGSSLNRGISKATGNASNFSNTSVGSSGYGGGDFGQRRHEYTAGSPDFGSANAVPPNGYFGTYICKFRRSFTSGDDGAPSATASNNFQSPEVFNGSRIENVDSIIRLINNDSISVRYIDVYQFAFSWYDVLVYNTVQPTACPFTFDTTAATPDQRGQIVAKAVTSTLINSNTQHNMKFLQHYLKKVGTLTLGPELSGTETVEFHVNKVPPQCVRSQTGMAYGFIFHNDVLKNGSVALSISYELENKFNESPASIHMPYLY